MHLQLVVFCNIYYFVFFFFFNDTATTEIYTLSLHDALPIQALRLAAVGLAFAAYVLLLDLDRLLQDRKSTRLNSSHANISYAVFCLKKKTIHPLAKTLTVNQYHSTETQ